MIAGGGFAVMAWKAARERTYDYDFPSAPDEFSAEACPNSPSAEYYRMLDNAERGFERLSGMRAFGRTDIVVWL